jgi:hypothetical protein
LALLVPLLFGGRCVDEKPNLYEVTYPVFTHDVDETDSVVVEGVPCDVPDTARMVVQNYAYKIECGCDEGGGRTCTVPVGTTVQWLFQDSEEHNIASNVGAFGESPDMLSGQWEATFKTLGEMEYKCSIHPHDMKNYYVVVREATQPVPDTGEEADAAGTADVESP